MLGFGGSAKVIDFNDGRGMRIRHIARFCETLGVESAHFVGNSMGAVNLFVDTTSDAPVLPVRSMVAVCGGGEIQRNEHSAALYDYDATLDGMRRIVTALFHDPSYPADDDVRAAAIRLEHRAGRMGSIGGSKVSPTRSGAAGAAVECTSIRPHRGADARGRGWWRQAAPARLGGRDRRADRVGPFGGDPGCRSLSADRTAGSGQRPASGFPGRAPGRVHMTPRSTFWRLLLVLSLRNVRLGVKGAA